MLYNELTALQKTVLTHVHALAGLEAQRRGYRVRKTKLEGVGGDEQRVCVPGGQGHAV